MACKKIAQGLNTWKMKICIALACLYLGFWICFAVMLIVWALIIEALKLAFWEVVDFMRWQINRDLSGGPRSLTFLGEESDEEREAREAREKKERIALKRQPAQDYVEWCEARGMLDEDGCLKEG